MNWQAALDAFNKVVAKDPGNANAQNYLGYTYRKSGQLDLAFKHYEEALRLNPKHRGAHEYMGEAYLMVNNLAKAEEQLKELDRICLLRLRGIRRPEKGGGRIQAENREQVINGASRRSLY